MNHHLPDFSGDSQFPKHFPDPLHRNTAIRATSSVIDFNPYRFRRHIAQDNDRLFIVAWRVLSTKVDLLSSVHPAIMIRQKNQLVGLC
jgi:hypothetical protein